MSTSDKKGCYAMNLFKRSRNPFLVDIFNRYVDIKINVPNRIIQSLCFSKYKKVYICTLGMTSNINEGLA